MNWTIKNNVAPTALSGLGKDPRIDSPQIKVVYPTKELPLETELTEPLVPQTQPKVPASVISKTTDGEQLQTQPPITASEPPHVCKLSFQDAVKAHSTAFILVGLGILALGFIIGKNKV